MEYRKMLASVLGRELNKGEIVHHIDGDQHNNRVENLEVLSSHKEHSKRHSKKIPCNNDFELLLNQTAKFEMESFKKSLTTFFSPRQIQIITRRATKQELSKTEKEVFSRYIKKRLVALANEKLYKISRNLLGLG